ncbi:MAG TPA: Gfo/Idh/MocA family oxidoreductase [Verrucomicrobiae bacterium]|nr:Gfo/Idh/MocA family oxidoreductase [Verrucomicrobiae bacterium]
MNRRNFLKQTGAAGVSLGMAGYLGSLGNANAQSDSPARAIGANDKITTAVIGTNGRGIAHIDCLARIPGVEISYICDVDDRAIAKGLKEVSKKQKTEAKGLKDFRKALEDKSLDAVTIATPDHWHTPMAILAMQAGKHVYLEKPCSQNPYEGEILLAAVNKYRRVVQMGAQRRSSAHMRQIIPEIHAGLIGKTYFGKGWYANNRGSIGHGKPAPVPEWLDYELWQGPAPRRPFIDNLVHYNWHWRWIYGTGEALNNGTHEIDVARWALGVDWPSRVSSNGGRYAFQDDWETPDTQTISWDFPEGKSMSWESRSCNDFPVEGRARGTLIYGTEGTALLDGNDYIIYDQKRKIVKQAKGDEVVDPTNTISASGIGMDTAHVANFIETIRGKDQLTCPISEGYKSVTLLHLGNIAWRVGRELHCDTTNGHIANDADAMKLWRREYEPGWEPKV